MTDRNDLLKDFAASCGIDPNDLKPLGGDASFRRYFRAGGFIIADSPPDTQKNREFVSIDRALGARGIRVPKLYKTDMDHGFFLEEDLGSTSFAMASSGEDAPRLYARAIDLASDVAFSGITDLPPFDADFIETEFGIFTKWWLGERHGIKPGDDDQDLLDETLEFFKKACLAQPQVPMHRDFHSRNIMVKDGGLCLIDFQDMVLGPLCYDTASLIFDCYVKLAKPLAHSLAVRAWENALERSVCHLSFNEYWRALLSVSLQRHVKVLGIFSRLHLRDGKDGYLQDLPRVLDYCLDEAGQLGLDDFAAFLRRCSEAPCAR